MKFTDLKKAIAELNETDLLEEKINVDSKRKKDELVEDFCSAIEAINEAGQIDKISDFVFNFYNDNFTEEEETKEVVDEAIEEKSNKQNEVKNEIKDNEMENKVIEIDKEEAVQEESIAIEDKKPKSKKKNKESVKKCKFRSGSRPFALYEKMKEGKKLEELLVDEEILVKFKNQKSWIKDNYVRISKEIEKGN